jgi:hypothetical protein
MRHSLNKAKPWYFQNAKRQAKNLNTQERIAGVLGKLLYDNRLRYFKQAKQGITIPSEVTLARLYTTALEAPENAS